MNRVLMGGLAATAAAVVASTASAGAGLIGDTVNADMQPDSLWITTPGSAVVGAGPEFSFDLLTIDTFFQADFDAFSMRLNYTGQGGLGMGAGEVQTYTDLDFDGGGQIVGVNVTVNGNVTGFDASDVTFTGDSLTLNLNGSSWSPGDTWAQFDFIVPAPGALALFGVAGLVGSRRRRA